MQEAIKRTFPDANWKIVKFANLALFEKTIPELGPPNAYNTALMEGALPDLKEQVSLTNFSPTGRDQQIMRRLLAFRCLKYMGLDNGVSPDTEGSGFRQRAVKNGQSALSTGVLWRGKPKELEDYDVRVKGWRIRNEWPDLVWLHSALVDWLQNNGYEEYRAHRCTITLKRKLALCPSWARDRRQVRSLYATPLSGSHRKTTGNKGCGEWLPNEGSVVHIKSDGSLIRIGAVFEVAWEDGVTDALVLGRPLKEESISSNVGDLRFLDEGEGARLLRYNKLLTDPVERTSQHMRSKEQFRIRRVSDISCDEDVHIIPHFKILGAFWLFKHRKVT